MDLGLVSAGAGLFGATIGGTMSFLSSWIVQQRQGPRTMAWPRQATPSGAL